MKIRTQLNNRQKPLIMGILNVTPDSFSDGGRFNQIDSALKQCERLIFEGADIIDIGGESTRPGAEYVPPEQEIERVIPVLEAINRNFDIITSVDTYKPELMREAIDVKVDMINDVKALTMPKALEVVASSQVEVCLMHMRGDPQTMQNNTQYDSVVDEVITFFNARITACQQAGIETQRITIDPGFGFGKTRQQNFKMLANFKKFKALGLPVLAGLSRKSMLGAVTGKPAQERITASAVGAAIAVLNGANIIRVHDVAATADAIAVAVATLEEL